MPTLLEDKKAAESAKLTALNAEAVQAAADLAADPGNMEKRKTALKCAKKALFHK